MPPTIQNGDTGNEKKVPKPQDKRTELIVRAKYCNTLPDIPFDLKFITYPFDSHRFIQYNPTSLERNYRYEVLTEHDLGVTIDLINRDLYTPDTRHTLHPNDEKLLEEDLHTPQDSQRSKQHARNVSWLRKSEYISTEQTRFQPQSLETIEAKVGYNVKKSLREETLHLDRDAQIKAIEKTFEDNKIEITKHYSKPGVTPVEVLDVLPDFENWKFPCAQVIFDFDPAPANKGTAAAMEEMSQAMIRGVMDESGEQFVAYFLPTDDTMEKRRKDFANEVLYEDDEEYEYKMAREYNWNVKSKASKGYEENYFFVVRNDGVYYDELETRVRLSKRRQKAGQQPSNTKLVVKHRPLNAGEHRMQRYRERQLEWINEDDEEEMEESEAEEGEKITKTGEKKTQEGSDAEQSDREGSRSRSGTPQSRRSRSRTRASSAGSKSSRSRSGSASSKGSQHSEKSGSRSRSGSAESKRSNSGSRKSGSRSRSGSAESKRSNSGSRKSGSRSRSRSASGSRHSGSKSRSRSGTPASNRSNSGSRKSGSRSRSSSAASSHKSGGSNKSRSRSRSGSSRSGSRSGSGSPVSRKSVSGSEHSGSGSDED
uniref:RNA polymerase II-associated factor 1 homolog n=1 Tax=Culicoides sonorensis TaxID=179676 RepID=A0A336MY23_CULSO